MLEFVRCMDEGDEAAWRRLWSSRAGVISLGSEPNEWWEGYERIVSLHGTQVAERAKARRAGLPVPHTMATGEILAFQEGSVGWGVHSTQLLSAGETFPFRLTGIFHLERGQWKLVHSHRSVGVPNEPITAGLHMTTNLEMMAWEVERERPNLAPVAAPNGTVTILFTDIEGSSKMNETLGDRAWLALLGEHNAIVRELAAINSGFEVKSQGDGFMLAFASARDALRCAIGIQSALTERSDGAGSLRVRMGLHTGEAIRKADDFFGKAVVIAARIAARAGGSEIQVSSLVRELVASSGEFELEGPDQVELKGLAGLHDVYLIRWRPATA